MIFLIDSFRECLVAEGIFLNVELVDNILINVNSLYKWKYVIIQLMERYGKGSFEFVLPIFNKKWILKIYITAIYNSTELKNFDLLFTFIRENFSVLFTKYYNILLIFVPNVKI